MFWKSLKASFSRNSQFGTNCTTLGILLQLPNDERTNNITNLNFVILFAKTYIYTCTQTGMQLYFYNSQVQFKTHIVFEKFRYNM